MGRNKYSTEFKQQVVQHYLNSDDGAKKTAKLFGVDHGAVRRWTEHWKVNGVEGFSIPTRSYSAEFKESVILWMKEHNQSSRKAAAQFRIAAACTVSKWERLYREGGIIALSDKRKERPMKPKKCKALNKEPINPPPEFQSVEEELEYLRAENAYLKKPSSLDPGKTEDKAKIITELRRTHKLKILLHIAGLSRSTYYWNTKSTSRVSRYDSEQQRITQLFHDHKGRYGYRRITLALRNEGYAINHKTVRKLMRKLGLASRLRIKKYQSYKGTYGKVAPNILERNFKANAPNQKWVTDVTEFKIKGEKLYLSPVLDLYNSEIIAWNMTTHPDMSLVENMLSNALKTLIPGDNPILHSDQGWQYQMARYQDTLKVKGIKQSMSRKGNCLDNAVIENFFGLLKTECWHNEEYENIDQLKVAVDEYIHYYNHDRIKVKLNGLSPVQYRTRTISAAS
ncbi:IS3 family transposase [Providencia rettgeri]|uniref:IS3 family transposase n=1 Tax=Providencia rettgeri TaxID=587 RepID=UPI003B671932